MSLSGVSQGASLAPEFEGDSKMKPNLGNSDRVFRFVLGLVLLVAPFVSGLALFDSVTATVIAVIVGLVMIATSAAKFCPLYRVFGIKTCPR